MRILHTSDWHLGRTLENINRIDEQREFIDELCSITEQENIDIVLVAGDVFDTYNPSAAAEELFYKAVDRLSGGGKRAVVVIAGNHDNPERLCAASPLACKNGVILLGYPGSDAGEYGLNTGHVRLIDSGPGWFELNISPYEYNAIIIALPYPSEARLELLLSREMDEKKLQQAYSDKMGEILSKLSEKFRQDTVNLIVSHLFILGGKESESERTIQVGGAMTVDPGVLPPNAHYAAFGHLHRPQKVRGAQCPAAYSGSPLAYSFSEADYCKEVFIIDAYPGKPAEVREIPLNCGKPLKRWKATGGMEEAVRWCREGRDANAWIDLEVYIDRVITAEEQRELRALHSGIINIRPVIMSEGLEIQEFETREGRKIDQLFKDFFKFRTGTEISEELMEVLLDVLNDEEREEEQDELGQQDESIPSVG